MSLYRNILERREEGKRMLAVLIDPDKFDPDSAPDFLKHLPKQTTHLFVGGSTVDEGMTEAVVDAIKPHTSIPVVLFPGDHGQLTDRADALLFLSLLSGRNPEYLIGQQVKAVSRLNGSAIEVIPTSYLLIDGGRRSAVEEVTQTAAMPQEDVEAIVHTAKAGELMGAKLCYLEAGSGANQVVRPTVIQAVHSALHIPVIVGGGIRSVEQLNAAYDAGADLVVMGTHFESN